MAYVDGFVIPVPKSNKQKYIEVAEAMAPIFLEQGALSVVKNWADDVPHGKITSFPMAVKCESDEEVVFSWIVWPSKEVRDEGNEAVMADPRMKQWDESDMPFDSKRMIFGGFHSIVTA